MIVPENQLGSVWFSFQNQFCGMIFQKLFLKSKYIIVFIFLMFSQKFFLNNFQKKSFENRCPNKFSENYFQLSYWDYSKFRHNFELVLFTIEPLHFNFLAYFFIR